MKVAFINSQCAGSTGSICSSIANYLVEQGHECRIFYGRFENKNNPAIFFGGSVVRNFINNLLAYFTGRVGEFHTAATKRLIKELTKFNPDVIHLNNLHGNYINLKNLFKYLAHFDGKVVMTLHDQYMMTGHCAISYSCDDFKSGCKKCSHHNFYPHVLLYRGRRLLKKKEEYLSAIKNLKIVSPSEWLNELTNYTFLAKYPRFVINNGINLPVSISKNNQHKMKVKLLFVASPWASYKGPNDIVDLSKKLDLNKYELVVVGRLDNSFKKFPENVTYLGQLSQEELSKIYDECDIFVDPTYQDNFPTVLLEAMAHGLPCIAYDTGGCKEIVTNEVGVIVKERNSDALFKAITNFDMSKFDTMKIQEKAKKYTKTIMAEKYFELYKN